MAKRSLLLMAAALLVGRAVTAQEIVTAAVPEAPGVAGDQNASGWSVAADAPARRPGALPLLYVSFGAMQAVDLYTTARALRSGAREQNPVLAQFGGHLGATLAVKVATGTATVFAVERLWKKSRARAIAVMAVADGVTAVVATHNLRVARAQAGR